jgi:hypothetical protein
MTVLYEVQWQGRAETTLEEAHDLEGATAKEDSPVKARLRGVRGTRAAAPDAEAGPTSPAGRGRRTSSKQDQPTGMSIGAPYVPQDCCAPYSIV